MWKPMVKANCARARKMASVADSIHPPLAQARWLTRFPEHSRAATSDQKNELRTPSFRQLPFYARANLSRALDTVADCPGRDRRPSRARLHREFETHHLTLTMRPHRFLVKSRPSNGCAQLERSCPPVPHVGAALALFQIEVVKLLHMHGMIAMMLENVALSRTGRAIDDVNGAQSLGLRHRTRGLRQPP